MSSLYKRNAIITFVFRFVCFSSSCLRSWLEQDTSCPTCRTSLNISGDGGQMRSQQQGGGLEDNIGPAAPDARPHINQHNHFFHFDGKSVRHKSEVKSGHEVTRHRKTLHHNKSYNLYIFLQGHALPAGCPVSQWK